MTAVILFCSAVLESASQQFVEQDVYGCQWVTSMSNPATIKDLGETARKTLCVMTLIAQDYIYPDPASSGCSLYCIVQWILDPVSQILCAV